MSEKLNDGFVKVIDDFLPTPTFNRLRDFVLGTEFPWHWTEHDYNPTDPTIEHIDTSKDGTFMLHHVLYTPKTKPSIFIPYFNIFHDIFLHRGFDLGDILKLKLNMYTNQGVRKNLVKHTDFYEESDKPLIYLTGVFCFTDDNGATCIGENEYKTKPNRMIAFDGNIEHWAYTQTNTNRRVILNLNYLRN